MINFAPNIYMMQYLTATEQNTIESTEKLLRFMTLGELLGMYRVFLSFLVLRFVVGVCGACVSVSYVCLNGLKNK